MSEPEWETLKVESIEGVRVVRLARPPVNAVNRKMMAELRQCFESIVDDRTVGAVVLSAEGDKAFCAGVDIRERLQESTNPSTDLQPIPDLVDSGRAWRAAQHAVRHCAVPVVAAVDGAAIGSGFGLAGVCDIIVASERATFGLTEINVGMLGGASKALRMVGPFKARMMFFSGEMVPAEEFYRLGAVETIVPPGEAEVAAIGIAKKFLTKSPIALRLAKESLLRIEASALEDDYRTEQDYTARLRTYRDSREAMAAFVEKRPPTWTWS